MFDTTKASAQLKAWALVLLMLAGTGALLTGCDQQGPAEEAGEEIDDAADDAGDAIDDTFD